MELSDKAREELSALGWTNREIYLLGKMRLIQEDRFWTGVWTGVLVTALFFGFIHLNHLFGY